MGYVILIGIFVVILVLWALTANESTEFSKWEIYEENQTMIRTIYAAPILGGHPVRERKVIVDIYVRHNLKTGLAEYKNVEKY